jgi:hypothetical protein
MNEGKTALQVVAAAVGAIVGAFVEWNWLGSITVITLVIGGVLGAGAVEVLYGKKA